MGANGAVKKPPVVTRNLGSPGTSQAQKSEDKESPDFKKKHALLTGPVLNMSYQNAAAYNMEESLFTSLKDIFEAIVANQSRTGVISPTKFLEVLRRDNEMFRSAMHQDAHEFLNLLLNTVVENVEAYAKKAEAEKAEEQSLSLSSSESEAEKQESQTVTLPPLLPAQNGTNGQQNRTRWVHELFEGTLTSETRCLTCENVSHRDEPFLDLSVDLDQHSSVTSCLRRFSEEEMLCERNKFHCDNCGGLQEAEKRMKIKRLPRILALHLKRFKYTEDLQRLQKLFHKVIYPYHLRLFNTTDDAEDPDRLYELYAVVVHIGGGPYHGHYVAIIKTEDRGWLLFDDEMVEPVEESYVRNFFGDRPGLACAYVLFYQETTIEAVRKEQMSNEKTLAPVNEAVGLGLKANGSAELHRIKSASPTGMPEDTDRYANLDHAISAPPFSLDPKPDISFPPPPAFSEIPASTSLSPKVQSKKERAREEKERKAAEKEMGKAEKQKQKELLNKLKDNHKKPESNARAELDTSKQSKVEERPTDEVLGKENTPLAGLERFRRSKSLRFGPLGRKDKPVVSTEETNASVALEESNDKDKDKEKEKRSRFSMRKKSFALLS